MCSELHSRWLRGLWHPLFICIEIFIGMGGIYNRYSSHLVDPRDEPGQPLSLASCSLRTAHLESTVCTSGLLCGTQLSPHPSGEMESREGSGKRHLLSAYCVLDLSLHIVSFNSPNNLVMGRHSHAPCTDKEGSERLSNLPQVTQVS